MMSCQEIAGSDHCPAAVSRMIPVCIGIRKVQPTNGSLVLLYKIYRWTTGTIVGLDLLPVSRAANRRLSNGALRL